MNIAKARLFLYGLLSQFHISIVGKLPLADLFLATTLPAVNAGRIVRSPKVTGIILSFILLLYFQVVSDVVNRSSAEDFVRGWALIAFGLVVTLVLADSLLKDRRSLLFFLVGAVLAEALFFQSGELNAEALGSNWFKVRYMELCNLVLYMVIFLFYRRNRNLVLGIVCIYGLACFYVDARSNGLIILLALVLVAGRNSILAPNFFRKIIAAVLLLVCTSFAYVLYVDAVLQDRVGGANASSQLNAIENPYNPIQLIILGRADSFALTLAIADKPLFGHGSWGKDETGRYSAYVFLGKENPNNSNRGYIHAHSVILGVWAYAGFFGFIAICMLYYYSFALFRYLYVLSGESPVFPIIVIEAVLAAWDALFSPIGVLRTSLPFFLALIISESFRYRKQIASLAHAKVKLV